MALAALQHVQEGGEESVCPVFGRESLRSNGGGVHLIVDGRVVRVVVTAGVLERGVYYLINNNLGKVRELWQAYHFIAV